MFRSKFSIATALIGLAVISLFLWLYTTLNEVREGEFNLYAADSAIGALGDFLERYNRWPNSKDELLSNAQYSESRFEGFDWPKDASNIMTRVDIDFGLTVEEVLKQGKDDFPVRVNRPIPESALSDRIDGLILLMEKKQEQSWETRGAAH